MNLELVDPRGVVQSRVDPLAPRRGDLDGPVVLGFLVNERNRTTGPDFWAYTEALEDALRQRLQITDVVREAKPLLSRPAGDDLLAHFRDCSGAISGLAK
ncbi:MAG: hypothetical protein KDB21_02625 [Acidimicrobiales bacterium]|nr:hypothetical protein [Acidimicrobiales bacterium]